MCGIVGVVSMVPVDRRLVERMRDRLAHRGPDHAGLWASDDDRICLGHRRLAIVDLSPAANQPFTSRDGRFVVTYNGEIYNFRGLWDELQRLGSRFDTRSDTEVLVEAFRHWGERCVERLSGMFAFAIWDRLEQRLYCARDRAGEKPFYYAVEEGAFIFASEVKALVLWPGFRRKIHYPALVDYLTLGYVADPKSIWEGCRKLPPAHRMWVEVRPDGPPLAREPSAYWDLQFDPDYSVSDWRPRILDTLTHATREMSFADVPVGSFLSGGVDSSSVTTALSKAGCRVTAFTVGFEETDYDERPWARQVAELNGVPHVERVVVPEDVSAVINRLMWHYDEPFNDYSYLPTFYLCREARKVITVALSGDGGDELFAGYLKYRRLALRQAVERVVPRALTGLLAAGGMALSSTASRLHQTLSQYRASPRDMLQEMLITICPLSTLRAAARGPLAQALREYGPRDVVMPLLRKAPLEKVGLVNAMRYLDLKLTLAGDILVKVDRASMAVSLEVRPVYLHPDMLTLAGRIPAPLLADRQETKKALKSALRCWLPDSILERRKMGFAMPLGRWVRGDLSQLFRQSTRRSFIDDVLDERLLRHISGVDTAAGDGTTAIAHSLFFLDRWLATWA
jgi:asparagine synthase (glutamine-hydrolysing)